MWVVMSTAAEHEKFLADVHVAVLNIRAKDKPSAECPDPDDSGLDQQWADDRAERRLFARLPPLSAEHDL